MPDSGKAPKPPVYISGGKRLNFNRRDEWTDELSEDFSGSGKDSSCYPSCSWAELCALAWLVMNHPAYDPSLIESPPSYYPPYIEEAP